MKTKIKNKDHNSKNHAWIVAVDMGYGHQRAAYPLRSLDHQEIINANNYNGIPSNDKKIWQQSRSAYEAFTRFKSFPLLGEAVWNIFDKFQSIKSFYPRRNLTKPTLQLKQTYRLIKKKQWGKHLVEKLAHDPHPFITTFFIPAFMAEVWNYPGPIYCVVTDADVSRAWAPLDPFKSRINYLAPTERVVERLKLYGVKDENIMLTGFPLPHECVGSQEKHLKDNLWRRLSVLDPQNIFHKNYGETLEQFLGKKPKLSKKEDKRVWIMFAVGGAGAQREIGAQILKSITEHIQSGRLGIILVAGVHNDVLGYFKKKIKKYHLSSYLNKGIKLVYANNKKDYFHQFNLDLRYTDILWTKPSELSFYAGLGIPVIIAPTIGSQEKFNKYWLELIGAGIAQENPKHTREWLIDYIEKGWLAEAALQGYLEAPREGVGNIRRVVFKN